MALTDDAIDKIKQMIISGRLAPGDRLPREADLATQLGLSRNSLREAVRALALINVLDVRQGDGTYVTSLAPGMLTEAISFIVDLQHDGSVLEFLEVRRLLEPAATSMATYRMTDDEVGELAELLDSLGDSPTVEALVANDQEFHRRIARASGNDVLASLIESVSGRTHRARVWRGLTQDSAVSRTLDEHRAIQLAIAQRQPDVASAWASVHVAGVEQWLRRTLSEAAAAGDLDPLITP
ncbi:FadR/GntR family transcriptional regulator [Kineosporia succinea]|uniref:DNA-binding FadR family transcriptional regulator n=1 Tax=Kineosporia succinea TaxID=84632 RepID=A0ABT9NZ25_9ACTN|nr:FadR/GntR family transcriptional regulator [Kineosporia succinea]MDP9825681.1 DNA-binding FadR family transcriptional regulator [Kineosporia succinea]